MKGYSALQTEYKKNGCNSDNGSEYKLHITYTRQLKQPLDFFKITWYILAVVRLEC